MNRVIVRISICAIVVFGAWQKCRTESETTQFVRFEMNINRSYDSEGRLQINTQKGIDKSGSLFYLLKFSENYWNGNTDTGYLNKAADWSIACSGKQLDVIDGIRELIRNNDTAKIKEVTNRIIGGLIKYEGEPTYNYNIFYWSITLSLIWIFCEHLLYIVKSLPISINKEKAIKMSKRILKLVAVCSVLIMAFLFLFNIWGTPHSYEYGIQNIEDNVATNAKQQYYIAAREGDLMQTYTQASLVAAAYLQATNEGEYRHWKHIEDSLAIRIGLPTYR